MNSEILEKLLYKKPENNDLLGKFGKIKERENFIRKLLKSHLCIITKIKKEDYDECALNKKRKTNIIPTNCIR